MEIVPLLYPSDVARVSRLLKIAVELLPETSHRAQSRRDQQYTISNYSRLGIPGFVASASLQAGDSASEALRLFSWGGVFYLAYTWIRGPTSPSWRNGILKSRNNSSRLRDEFDSNPITDINCEEDERVISQLSLITCRHSIAKEFESSIQSIRALKVFERFLPGPIEDDLLDLASHGPIIIINVSRSDSNAFLVTSQKITSLPLPALRFTDEEKSRIFLEAVRKINTANYQRSNKEVQIILE